MPSPDELRHIDEAHEAMLLKRPQAPDLDTARALIDQLTTALTMLLDDVESVVDMGMPFENPDNGFHESVMAARKALGRP